LGAAAYEGTGMACRGKGAGEGYTVRRARQTELFFAEPGLEV